MVVNWWVLYILICSVSAFEVPIEWREAIRDLCLVVENSVYPHPSPDAQRLYGKNAIGTQVYLTLRVFYQAADAQSIRLSAAFYNVRVTQEWNPQMSLRLCFARVLDTGS